MFFLFLIFTYFENAIAAKNSSHHHQLCPPCVLAANAVKTAYNLPPVKEAEKSTCNRIIKNKSMCNSAIEVAGMYLKFVSAEKMCQTAMMCGASEKKSRKIRAIPAGNNLTKKILDIFDISKSYDEFPITQNREPREAVDYPINQLSINPEELQKFITDHSDEYIKLFESFSKKFAEAVEVYTNATNK